jgi:hypothetical protein
MFRVACAAALAAILATTPAALPAWAREQPSTASPDAGADVEPRRLSRVDFLALVERLIRAGQLNEVKRSEASFHVGQEPRSAVRGSCRSAAIILAQCRPNPSVDGSEP